MERDDHDDQHGARPNSLAEWHSGLLAFCAQHLPALERGHLEHDFRSCNRPGFERSRSTGSKSFPAKGLTYWGYKLSDDTRAGNVQTDATGRVIGYSGQIAIYKAALFRMKSAEDFGSTELVFPDQGMGEGRDQNALNIFGW